MRKFLNNFFSKSNWFLLFMLKPVYDVTISNISLTPNFSAMNIWINAIIQVIIILLLVFISKSFVNLNFKMNVLNDILKIRYRKIYLEGITEATKKYLNELYFGDLIDEKRRVKNFLSKKYPGKKGTEINEILDEIYPELNKPKK